MTAILEVRELSKSFGGLTAVDRVSFDVRQGEILAVIGPNGAGKTTLFSLVSGFITPDSGSVTLAGAPITGLKPPAVARRGLARSFQIVQVFAGMSVLDAVTAAALLRLPLNDAIARARAVLDDIGLASRADAIPDSLSMQDRKLLEIAKCIATGPRIILLDEVMSGLTLAEAQVPLAEIRRLRDGGITFVMVEHVMPVVMSLADRIVVLNFGQKVAEGTPDEIVANEAVREAYFGEDMDA
ncbi:MAG TPA: ABC transporter ATP-binding protein [Acetobacteraceae bacterium]|nr:ABC transporter ATP-binding protein [Acetobacteraceae bacterium]